MATPFSNIYTRFLRKITDYKLADLIINDSTTAENRLYGWLESSIPKFSKCINDLSDRDAANKVFNTDLSDLESEILSNLMVAEWLEPEVKNIMDMQNVLFNDDWKTYSTANLLKEKKELLQDAIERSDKLIVDYTFETIDFSRFSG
jgi:hypothetical protein